MSFFFIFGDPLIYGLLQIATVLTLLICGYLISKEKKISSKKFWTIAAVAIIIYTITQGLRWGRGVDYWWYLESASGIYRDKDEQQMAEEPLFFLLITIFRTKIIPPYFLFVVQSFLLIYSYIKVVRNFPKTAVWSFPLFFFIFGVYGITMVRQDLALSLVLLALSSYLNNQKKWMWIMLALSPLIHFSAFIAILPFAAIVLMPYSYKRWHGLSFLSIYILIIMFWNPSWFQAIANLLTQSDLGTESVRAEAYVNNASDVLTLQGALIVSDTTKQSIFFKISDYLCCSITILLGYESLKYNKKLKVPYIFTLVAIYLNQMGAGMEIWDRIMSWFLYMMPIILSLAILEAKKINKYVFVFVFLCVLYKYYFYFIKNIGTIPSWGCAFVWDAI